MCLNPFKIAPVLVMLSVLPHWALAADLEITGAWARPTPPGSQVAAVYFSITNRGVQDDELLALESEAAALVEIHDSRTVNGVMQMRPVASVHCPAGVTVKVEPGGLHVMLLGLKHPLLDGTRLQLSLRFRDAGTVLLQVPVRNGA